MQSIKYVTKSIEPLSRGLDAASMITGQLHHANAPKTDPGGIVLASYM